ncbi:uncharacterized protein CELE_C48B4.6 [Caenorhabditis elegans]|uniref:Uncharacterized protein C48B4.6 n=1 Tax=Caenorhabditis elegans TaxID=6239 RepID=YLH6_CAEEL|nr:Uncharacterized protein CELE_C48B4.6 [Caenorhabditis elegans]P34360.1 RecName: Full=Uncharacterized protein C48B4.6 [Caenorhabditis elegans]CAA82378.1 Uncharacterized protein CELE_C48B4.6 [Caenorhabditis elegans]|eukprot:NP_499109.1 Uncharacterized protein CELE_C48B4.6 [Caenorhabditis elegans]
MSKTAALTDIEKSKATISFWKFIAMFIQALFLIGLVEDLCYYHMFYSRQYFFLEILVTIHTGFSFIVFLIEHKPLIMLHVGYMTLLTIIPIAYMVMQGVEFGILIFDDYHILVFRDFHKFGCSIMFSLYYIGYIVVCFLFIEALEKKPVLPQVYSIKPKLVAAVNPSNNCNVYPML